MATRHTRRHRSRDQSILAARVAKFHDKGKTEEESVSYHHKFSDKGHPRGSDGTFRNMSDGCKLGLERYGKK